MSERSPKHELIFAMFLMSILYVIATYFYHNVEGWSILDSVYFVTATFTTIGYGDHVPVTAWGKIFTIFISWIGISTGIYLIYSMIAYREKAVDQEIVKRLRIMKDLFHNKEEEKKD